MSEQQIEAAAKELHEYVRERLSPWTDFRGHEMIFAKIIRKHAESGVSKDTA